MSTEPPSPDLVNTLKTYAAEIAAVFGGLALLLGKVAEWREKERAQRRDLWDLQSTRLNAREEYLIKTVRETDQETIRQLREDLDREQERVTTLQADYSKLLDFARTSYERKESYKHRFKVAHARLLGALRQLERTYPGRYQGQIAQIESEARSEGEQSQINFSRFDPQSPPTNS